MKIQESDQTKTSFTWKGAQYMFVGAPFGIKTLTSVFQRIVSQLFHKLNYVACFVDDILIFSKTVEEHENHLKTVLQILTENNLTINEEKCKFFYERVNVLGHNLSKNGVNIDPKKIKEMWDFPKPTTSKDI